MFNEFNTLKLFFDEPNREFNVREVARLLKVSPPTVSTRLKGFAKVGVLKYRKERMLDLYKANLDSEDYINLKVFYLVKGLKDVGLMDYLNKVYLKPVIVLFGSGADGLDTEMSDVDLLIVSEKTKVVDCKKFERKLKRKVHLVVVENLKKLKNEHLLNNVLNGVRVQGRLEIERFK
jgi:predicted nucleotidyltransferase